MKVDPGKLLWDEKTKPINVKLVKGGFSSKEVQKVSDSTAPISKGILRKKESIEESAIRPAKEAKMNFGIENAKPTKVPKKELGRDAQSPHSPEEEHQQATAEMVKISEGIFDIIVTCTCGDQITVRCETDLAPAKPATELKASCEPEPEIREEEPEKEIPTLDDQDS